MNSEAAFVRLGVVDESLIRYLVAIALVGSTYRRLNPVLSRQ